VWYLLTLEYIITRLLIYTVDTHTLYSFSPSTIVPIHIVLLDVTHTPLLNLILLLLRSILFQSFNFRIYLLYLKEHPLHFNIIVLS
jgi:hypothetical protein